MYAGETYDARTGNQGMGRTGINDAGWKPVDLGANGESRDSGQSGRAGATDRRNSNGAVTRPKPGLAVYDYGRNFSGWARLRITAPSGTKIVMRFGEMLNPDGTVYRTNLRGPCDGHLCLQGRRRRNLGTCASPIMGSSMSRWRVCRRPLVPET